MDAVFILADFELSLLGVVAVLLIALLMSCYVKIVTVLGIVRFGLGVDSLPSVLVTGGLALALTLVVMFPTIDASVAAMRRAAGGDPGVALAGSARVAALEAGFDQWKQFLLRHTDPNVAQKFAGIAGNLDRSAAAAGAAAGKTPAGSSASAATSTWRILAPAFLVSELKRAFAIGLSLLIPLLVVDLIVAHTLTAVGVERLEAAVVSFPFKILLFVMADGWSAITGNLVASYG